MGVQNSFKATTAENQGLTNQTNYGNAIINALASSADQSQAEGVNGQQSTLAQALQAQANGQGPANNLAAQALKQSTNQAQQQSAGTAASMKGMNPALAARQALQNQATQSQAAAGQYVNAVGNNSLNAQSQLGNELNAQRGQDIQQQQTNAGVLGTAGGLQNTQNANNISDYQTTQGINAGISKQNQDSTNNLLGGIGKAVSGGIAALLAKGGIVPGKAKVPGDSYENDTVGTDLSPGEIVLPRSVALADDAPERAKAFVEAIQKKNTEPQNKVEIDPEKTKEFLKALKAKSSKAAINAPDGYGRVLETQRNLQARISKLEAMLQARG